MKNLKIYINDIIKAFLYGMAAAAAVGVISLTAGLFISDFNINGIVDTVRAGRLITGSLSLFAVAGILLSKKEMIVKSMDSWRRQFEKLNFVHVLSIAGTAVLTFAVIIDYAALMFK